MKNVMKSAAVTVLASLLMSRCSITYPGAKDLPDEYPLFEGNDVRSVSYDMAHKLHYGLGVEKDDDRALKLYRGAIKDGDIRAYNAIGLLRLTPGSEVFNPPLAFQAFQNGAKAGSSAALYNIGMGLYTGVLNLPSGENGMDQLLAAAHMGNPKAQGFLASIAMKHHENMTDEDARLYAMQAADGKEIAQWQAIYQGSEHTEVWDRFFRMNLDDRKRMLSDILAVETTVQNGIHETAADVKEVEFIRGRAENGDRTAQYNLGLLYLNGEGVPKNIEAGSRMILKSAYQDYTPAYYMAGKLFYDGLGVQRDHVVAYAYFNLAAADSSGLTEAAWAREMRAYMERHSSRSVVAQGQKVTREELRGAHKKPQPKPVVMKDNK